MRRAAHVGIVLILGACTPLRPLDPEPGADAGRLDGGLVSDAPGFDARRPGEDAFVAPGTDAFTVSPDAFVPPDAFAGLDANCLPAGPELCATPTDDDCDGSVNEADAIDARTWYPDADRDGFGEDARALVGCSRPPDVGTTRWVERGGDCNDRDDRVRPGRIEGCNAVDDDCDGLIDDGDPCSATVGCTTGVFGGHTYQFCDGAMPWDMARAQCEGWGYHLVHLEDAAENAWVTSTALARGLGEPGTSPHVCAIGLRLDAASSAYRWTDGAIATFTPWEVGEPNGTGPCVRIRDASGVWSDARCTIVPFDFVCETP